MLSRMYAFLKPVISYKDSYIGDCANNSQKLKDSVDCVYLIYFNLTYWLCWHVKIKM